MSFATVRRLGVAAWPFRYARAQEGRLRAMASKVPQGTRLTWVLVVATLWFFIGFAIGFLPLMPFLSANVSASRGALAGVSLTVGIAANLLSGCMLGHVIAAWTGSRILNALIALPALKQVSGDDELLASIRRQVVRLASFGVLSAVEPLLAAMFLLQPQA
jgi:uncharacterized membrane protein